MQLWTRACLLVWALGCVILLAQLGDSAGAQTPPEPKKASDQKDLAGKKLTLDKFTMPPGGMVVLVEEMKDVRGYFPRMVILTPENYQELLDRIATLEKQIKGERRTPQQCRINATVTGDSVQVEAELHIQSDSPHASVLLGFRGVQLSDAKILREAAKAEWSTAAVELANDGYVIALDKLGTYQVRLEGRVPLMSGTGGERSLDLALPGAAVTTLAVDLPEAVKEVRWNKTNVERPAPPALEQKHWELAVGKVTQLQVSFKPGTATGGNEPLRTAHGHVSVRFDDAVVTTTADLTLTDLRGKAKEWRLWVPPQAKLKAMSPADVKIVQEPANPFLRVLTLMAPTAEPIKLQIIQTSFRGNSAKISVGPFSILDAASQEGTIEVRVPVELRRVLRLLYHTGPGLIEREAPSDSKGDAVVAEFKYNAMPTPPAKATLATAIKAMAPPLEIEQRANRGKVETQVEHQLRLRPAERGWQVAAACKITVRPLDAPVDSLDVQLPRIPAESWPLVVGPGHLGFPAALPWSNWALGSQTPRDGAWVVAETSAPVELVFPDAVAKVERRARLQWSKPQQTEITLTLTGSYSIPAGLEQVRLELPRTIDTHDRGGKGVVEVPDNLELLVHDGVIDQPVSAKQMAERTWERAPAHWDLAWRPYRPAWAMKIVADVTLHARYAHVEQRLDWDGTDQSRDAVGRAIPIKLHVPASIKGLRISDGGKLLTHDTKKELALVERTGSSAKAGLTIAYDFALPAEDAKGQLASFRVPFVWPEQATRANTKVRLWCSPGSHLEPATVDSAGELGPNTAWKAAFREVVPSRDELPGAVLVSEAVNPPALVLQMRRTAATLHGVMIERALVDVQIDEAGAEHYRARFLLTKLHVAALDVRLPLPLQKLNPRFLIAGKETSWHPLEPGGSIARVNVERVLGIGPAGSSGDSGNNRATILEVIYTLPRGQSGEGALHSTLQPPLLESDAFVGQVRWQVTLPPDQIAVAPLGKAESINAWAWRGWLPELCPALSSNDLERWLTGRNQVESPEEASLVSQSADLEPLRLIHTRRTSWIALLSGIVLLAGLGLYALPRPEWRLGLVLSIGCVAGAAAWLWPDILPAILYGAAPGVLIVAVLWLAAWLLHQRYKRQLLYMPGFSRLTAGSPLLKAPLEPRRGEPSTIDAPKVFGEFEAQ